ncbi:MAG: acyl-CoA thioesterase [Lentisphaerae bacterium]|nr:acyl-CoA thioesterase [Lentisphaerota bacterium]
MTRRRDIAHFQNPPNAPLPLKGLITRRVAFNEVDPLGIVWHGRYAVFFEHGAADLERKCGLSYADFLKSGIRAPIVEFHVEYYEPLYLDEEFTIETKIVWNEAAKITIEYRLVKLSGAISSSAYTIQLLTYAATGEVCLVPPDMLQQCREKWRSGAFAELQQ